MIDERHYTIDPATGCWLWAMHTNPGGYGVKTVAGRKIDDEDIPF